MLMDHRPNLAVPAVPSIFGVYGLLYFWDMYSIGPIIGNQYLKPTGHDAKVKTYVQHK